MSMDLMIPSKADVPSYVIDAAQAASDIAAAAAGVSAGFFARVKLSGKQFTLVNGSGEETPFPPASLSKGGGNDGNMYFPVIVLRSKVSFSKSWYLKKYNPNAPKADMVAPDCFSNDGIKPDASVRAPCSELCANCAYNAYGSGTDQDGNATDGKACSDNKILAVFVPGYGVHQFKIPPGSLKNWGLYMKQYKNNLEDVPLRNTVTFIGFDLTLTKSVLVFRFGGFVGEGKDAATQARMLAKITEYAASQEVTDMIVSEGDPTSSAKQLAAPAPAPVDDHGLGDDATAKAETDKKAAAAAKKKAAAEKKTKEEVVQEPEVLDVGGRDVRELTDAQLAADLGL